MAGSITVSSITLDSDNNFSIKSNTGATLFFANTTGIDVANSFASSSITSDKILTVANTKISGNIISSQITSVANTQLTGTITGSQISSNTLSNTVFQTGSVENYMNATGLGFGMRNRIINGAMAINQRGASVTASGYTVDRFQYVASASSKGTLAQSTTVYPTGFNYSLGFTSSSAYSVASGDYFAINQTIEGYNIADLGWGTANTKTVTLSFWVYSSLTGTFGGSLSSYASTRSYPFTYTISSANTWTQISITVAGDTSISSTNWKIDNNAGMNVWFGLGVGSTYSGTAGSWSGSAYYSATGATSIVGTSGATFYITGVQLEKGMTATSFDYRSYGTELNLCQRYYQRQTGGGRHFIGGNGGVSNCFPTAYLLQTLRSTPTFSYSAVGDFTVEGITGGGQSTCTALSLNAYTFNSVTVSATTSSGTGSTGGQLLGNSSSVWTAFSAEL